MNNKSMNYKAMNNNAMDNEYKSSSNNLINQLPSINENIEEDYTNDKDNDRIISSPTIEAMYDYDDMQHAKKLSLQDQNNYKSKVIRN